MEEESSSWLRRVKYSHTVCHRLDSSVLFSVTPNRQTVGGDSGLKSRPGTSFDDHRSGGSSSGQSLRNSSIFRHRSISPVPEIGLSDAFKEARSAQKRFSTPLPRTNETNEPDKRVIRKSVSSKDARKTKASGSLSPSSTSPLRHFSSMKGSDKSKSRKDSAWAKYFDHGGGRVTAVEMNDELNVDLSKLLVGARFACGANSRLYHGIYKDQPVAVKIIRQPDDDENVAAQLEKQFDREVIHLSRLHHKNVIKLVAACRQPPVFFIITEYLAGGSLRAFLHKLERKSLPSDKLVRIALEIARGMEYIHSQGVVHRDLKPENLLFDEELHMKIVDFGIACKEAYCESLVEDPGTYRWMAPEMIKRKSHGRKVDVYSFGLILWEMVAGRTPFEDKTPIQAAFAVVNKNLRPIIPVNCPPALQALIEQCWAHNPDKRPEFWQIVKVLEHFQSSLDRDGTLNLVQYSSSKDHKKGLLHWIDKLGHGGHAGHVSHVSHAGHALQGLPMAKPRFS